MSNVPRRTPVRHVVRAAPQVKRTDAVSVAALATGLLGFCVPGLGLVGIVLGLMGIRRTAQPHVAGRGSAIAGVVCGALGTLILLVVIGILIPSLNRARAIALRVQCEAQMKQIGTGIVLYTNANNGQLPPSLSGLIASQNLNPRLFVCPSSGSLPGSTRFASDASARAVGLLNYVYVGEGLTVRTMKQDLPLLLEPLSHHDGDGGNVLYASGTVEFVKHDDYVVLINSLRGKPGLSDEEYQALIGQ